MAGFFKTAQNYNIILMYIQKIAFCDPCKGRKKSVLINFASAFLSAAQIKTT